MGVLLVGLAGVFILGLFLVWIRISLDEMLAARLEIEARAQARYFQETVSRRIGPSLPEVDPQRWALHEAALDRSFAGLPYLLGVVLWQDGARVCVIENGALSPTETGEMIAPGPGGLALRRGEAGRAAAAFEVTVPEGVTTTMVGNVFFAFDALDGARKHLEDVATYGVLVLGVVIYLLAALAMLISRAQIGLLNRERETSTRLRAIGQVAGGIAHEVRNPLNAISLLVQYMERRGARDGTLPEPADFARIHLELGKIRKVVDNFVNFARIRDLVVQVVDVGALMEETLDGVKPELDDRRIRCEFVRDGALECRCDHEKIGQVLRAVVENAIDAMQGREEGELRVRVSGDRRVVRVTVRDNGEVMDERIAQNIFEPYFTTRDHALGLGMTVARTLVESHGGSIAAAPAQGGGCVVTMTLPRKFA